MTAEVIEFFKKIESGFISDAMSTIGINGWMNDIHPSNPSHKICGRAFTVLFTDDTEKYPEPMNIFEVLSHAESDDVIIISADSNGSAYGEKVARAAQQMGLQALVTDGPTRDHRTVDEMGFPCFSSGVTNRVRSSNFVPRAYQIPIMCGGVPVSPGDLVIGDIDGVIVLPESQVSQVYVQTQWVQNVESEMDRVIADGCSPVELKLLSRKKKSLKED